MDTLRAIHRVLGKLETFLAAGSLLLLVALALTQILARNLFDSGLPAIDHLTRYLVLYVTFFGAALAVTRGRHIKIDIGCTFMSAAALRRLYRPMHAVSALVCALLSAAAIRFWLDEWLYATPQEHWQVLIALVIPVGFLVLTAEFTLATLLGQPRDNARCSTR